MANKMKKWMRKAGEVQIKRLHEPKKITTKSSEIDPVTEVDIWTENFLIHKIQKAYPTHRLLTEESGNYDGNAEYEWVIDPIDGTVNYAHGFPLFCISVAVKHKNETVVGLVYVPMLDEFYEAIKGSGAFLNGKRISVSSIDKLKKAVISTGFPYDRATDPLNNVDYFNGVILNIAGIRRTGSAAIDLCQVAAGRFDGYWEFKLNAWDIEAGLLIVEEAGGETKRIKQKKGNFVLAGNKMIFPQLEALLNKVKPIT
ncbi:inositol monophosphatase [Pueribacillus theae]|uniref:Inositol-1-monophosphatase n=2 Tax=Pueribacillus theae TaxID=2171751 RepID=A0A2U1JZP3_9BACI|nr:inositol monophosphatase [Pueribacillus theae]